MKAPEFIRIRGEAEWLRKLLVKGDELELSFGEQRQRETTYVVENVTPYAMQLRKKFLKRYT